MFDKTYAHLGLAGARPSHNKNRMAVEKRAADCTSTQFYKSPAAGASVSYDGDFVMEWDTSCLDTKTVDIYLYDPAMPSSRIHIWQDVPFSPGSYKSQLRPKWWNSTSSATLYLSIVEQNTPQYMAKFPKGPNFTATYSAPSSGSTPSSADVTKADATVEQVGVSSSNMTKGGIAAAVLVPIIVMAALLAAVFIKLSRAKSSRDRGQAKVDIDRRMSRISQDWKSITHEGATEAIRRSMAIPGNRTSSFSFGGIRPMSGVAVESGQAGVGARGMGYETSSTDSSGPVYGMDQPHMSQLRPGVRASAFEERKSRAISFADQTRPSLDARKTVTSRAFHSAFVPPVPTRSDTSYSSPGELSPTQAAGPFSLNADDIHARLSSAPANMEPRPSVDEVMPAISMMRQGGAGEFADDALFMTPEQLPTPPPPVHENAPGVVERSPIMGVMPFQPMPATTAVVGSPDDLMKAYAARRAEGGQ